MYFRELFVLVAAMAMAVPHIVTADFSGGTATCDTATSLGKCTSTGAANCTVSKRICSGGAFWDSIDCVEGGGSAVANCARRSSCGNDSHASRDTNCL